ncbi:hypothetical protein STEG23_007890, partial [Scotinomys teguina]
MVTSSMASWLLLFIPDWHLSFCCLALDSSSSFPCPAFLAITKSNPGPPACGWRCHSGLGPPTSIERGNAPGDPSPRTDAKPLDAKARGFYYIHSPAPTSLEPPCQSNKQVKFKSSFQGLLFGKPDHDHVSTPVNTYYILYHYNRESFVSACALCSAPQASYQLAVVDQEGPLGLGGAGRNRHEMLAKIWSPSPMDRIESLKVLDGSQRQRFEPECGNIVIVVVIKPDKALQAADVMTAEDSQGMKFGEKDNKQVML